MKGARVPRERMRRQGAYESGSHKRQLEQVPAGSPSHKGEARTCFP